MLDHVGGQRRADTPVGTGRCGVADVGRRAHRAGKHDEVVAPLLAVVRVGKVLENSTDYSIQNTLRQALFLPTTREAKYKAKAAIDTFFTRTGDVVSAGFVALGQVMGLSTSVFAGLNVGLTVAWLWVARQISTAHRQRTV